MLCARSALNRFLLHTGAEREPSNARLPEVSEYDFTLHKDGRNYNIDVRIFFNRLLNDKRKVSEANLSRVIINFHFIRNYDIPEFTFYAQNKAFRLDTFFDSFMNLWTFHILYNVPS